MRKIQNNHLLQILIQSEGATAVYDDADLNIAFANQAMLDFWNQDERIIDKKFADVFPEFTEQGFTAILKEVWESGKSYRALEKPAHVMRNGKKDLKYFDYVFQAVIDKNGNTYAIIHTAIDVTVKRSALKTVQEQDVMITFNNELEMLTNTLSHDLKNPLSLVKMGVQYLKNKGELSAEEKDRWVNLVLDAIANVESIVDHTVQLNQARLSRYSTECHNMESMIRKICMESQLLYGVDAQCQFDTGDLEPLYGDKGVLYQIFLNIVGNAVKYSSRQDKPTVWIKSRREKDFVVYTIKDHGIGIPERDLPHIFKQFSRGSNVKGYLGTGIGLCLVKKIMDRMNGNIKVYSVLSEGTTVELYFPRNGYQERKCGDQ